MKTHSASSILRKCITERYIAVDNNKQRTTK